VPGRQSDADKAKKQSAPKTVKARWAEDLESQYDVLMTVIKDALNSEKQVQIREPCPKCTCSHFRYATVRDTNAALKAAEFLANRGLGRPGEDSTRVDSTFTVNRYVVEPDEVEEGA